MFNRTSYYDNSIIAARFSAGVRQIDNGWGFTYLEGQRHMDGISDELSTLAHPFWGTFPPQNPIWNYCFALLYAILCLFNWIGNGLVMFIFMKWVKYHKSFNMNISIWGPKLWEPHRTCWSSTWHSVTSSWCSHSVRYSSCLPSRPNTSPFLPSGVNYTLS